MKRVVRDPYSGIDWSSVGRYKANLHAHTTESDGAQTPVEVVDEYHARGYEILAITDHDTYLNRSGIGLSTWPWSDFGRDPERLGMLAVRGNEFTGSPPAGEMPHLIGLFAELWRPSDPFSTEQNNVDWILSELGVRGGLAHWAHPSRSGEVCVHGDDPQWFLDRHQTHRHLCGFEIHSGSGRETPVQSVDLYDGILTTLRAAGHELVFSANAADDSHRAADIGFDYHVHLMPERSDAALRASIKAGAYFAVMDPHGNALGRHICERDGDFYTAAPIIERIKVSDDRIAITASQRTRTRWYTDFGAEIAHDDTLDLRDPDLGKYVRARLEGDSGSLTYTQPWYLEDRDPD